VFISSGGEVRRRDDVDIDDIDDGLVASFRYCHIPA